MDSIGDTIPKTLLCTFWHHQSKTDSNTSVDGSYHKGLHLLGRARNSAHYDTNDSEYHVTHWNIIHTCKKSSVVHGNLLIDKIGSTGTFSSMNSTNNNK